MSLNPSGTSEEWAEQRQRMVEEQLRARGIQSPAVLAVMGTVPRHYFVDPALPDDAYSDRPLPIGFEQTISQPYMVALMTELLNLQGTEQVLEVGTGSGYQTAVLAELTGSIVSLERIPELAMQAKERLARLGYRNVEVITGDGVQGYLPQAPYDRILVTAGATIVPPALYTQLKEGGVLVIPVGDRQQQTLLAVERHSKGWTQREICGCVFVPLIGEAPHP
ncbi:MAG: protein-L-isoaspartate(D-aspartate) O-methyltransferase [Elusimicrobia bacterium]|nr:protein-L-isoaspartate(D-aspartate) O-methyltransferase [Elusimicrobiota bacterium]